MLKIDFEKLRNEFLKDIIPALESALDELQIDYYLIGALARDAWFMQDELNSRSTSDVDFAIYISEGAKFEELKRFLIEKWKFSESSNNPFAMISPVGITVDILPFGSIEFTDDLKVEGIVTNGFIEVYRKALETFVSNDRLTLKVATLPAIILLKMIAFQDRPEMRLKDPQDIYEIIVNYFDLQSELIFEKHHDLFQQENQFESEPVSCRVIGREIRDIISDNAVLQQRIIHFLAAEIDKAEKSAFLRSMNYTNKHNPDQIMNWLVEIVGGLKD